MNNARKAIASLILASLVFVSLATSGFSQNPPASQAPAPASEVSQTRTTPPAKRRQLDAGEKLVRDVYARLMRYQSAARDQVAARENKSSAPDDYLTFELRDIRNGTVEEISHRRLAELASPRDGAVLKVVPGHLRNGDGVAHAYYDAQWTNSPAAATNADSKVGDMVKKGQTATTRYSSYEVTIRLQGQKRSYRALVLYQIPDNEKSRKPTSVQILDNITPEMNTVLQDESPAVTAPWDEYIHSNRYRAVVADVKSTKAAGQELIPLDAPIGYLPGDMAEGFATLNDDCLNIRIAKADGGDLPPTLRVGVTAGGHDRSQLLKAVVFPANEAANVTISVSSGLTLSNVSAPSNGEITFRVVGNLTAGSVNEGDQNISAFHIAEPVFASKDVTVVVPWQVATPHDTTGGGMVIANRALDATTSPGILGLPPGTVMLTTIYVRFLTITVHDRWNHPIGDLYAGAAVTETFGGSNFPINQTLSTNSTYLDPVGYPEGQQVVAAGSPAAIAWPSAPPNPLSHNNSEVQNVAVQIDGFNLNPAIVNRTVTAVAPNNVTITWP